MTMKTMLTAALLLALAAAPARAEVTQARVTGGAVQGVAENGLGVFKGIPFAAPPTGERRWREPQPVQPWQGVKQTTAFGPGCVQDTTSLARLSGVSLPVSEDCLYLNVWTPAHAPGEKLPVMVWIYGGAFTGGATAIPLYDGASLAHRGVIVVSVAYRVGPFGFLATPELSAESGHGSGNFGLEDMIAGLKWVKGNIAAFGGDPKRVTIFGESAGGIAVSMLVQSPLAKGLFSGAISESGGSFTPAKVDGEGGQLTPTLKAAEADGQAFLGTLGVKTIAEARALSADQVMKGRGMLWPNYDGRVLPGDPYALYETGRQNDVPVLIGTNSDEGALFTPPNVPPAQVEQQIRSGYGRYADQMLAAYPHATPAEARTSAKNLFRDTAFAWPTWTWARLQSKSGKGKVFAYFFDQHSPTIPGSPFNDPDGATHASEIAYVFGNLSADYGPQDREVSDRMGAYWTNFAKTGDPNGPGLPHWPSFTGAGEETMVLDGAPRVTATPNKVGLIVLDDYFGWRRQEAKSAGK
jgi:para-nitrobenzyl esterase